MTEPQFKPIFHSYSDILGVSATPGFTNSFSSNISIRSSSHHSNNSSASVGIAVTQPLKFRPKSAMKYLIT